MKVLVTGGGGFLGSVICSMLVSRGDKVQSISRNP
ncbi:MAG: SDR family oxidoreductase, partial [Planctomycetia bacterium]|nr:SDR family oxidoreductase [Planctomycetia bacterium]